MSDVYVMIKIDEKEVHVKLKSSTLNNGNLAMIFRLDLTGSKGINVHFFRKRGDNSPNRYWILPRRGL